MSAEGQFPVVMRGYNRAEVDSAIAGLQRELMDANTERSAAVGRHDINAFGNRFYNASPTRNVQGGVVINL